MDQTPEQNGTLAAPCRLATNPRWLGCFAVLLSIICVKSVHDPEVAKHMKSAKARKVSDRNAIIGHCLRGLSAKWILPRPQVAAATSANPTKLADLTDPEVAWARPMQHPGNRCVKKTIEPSIVQFSLYCCVTLWHCYAVVL